MQNSRLLQLFQSLNKKDLRELRKFVHSPFFNQRQDVIDLMDYMTRHCPFRRPKLLERKTIFAHIFPNETYDEKKLGYAMTFLHQAIKRFLAYQNFAADEVLHQIHLTNALRQKGLNRHFESELKVAQQLLKKQPLRNIAYHYQNYRLYFEHYEFTNNKSRTAAESFQELSDEMTVFFMASKLKQSCTALSHQNVSKTYYQQDLLKAVLEQVEQKNYDDVPAISIYYNGYMALTAERHWPYFQQLRQLIQQFYTQFPKNELKDIYLLAINYCIRHYNAGEKSILEDLLDLYKEGLNRKIFIENGLLSRFTYKNIAMTGLGLGDFDWVESFLYEYKKYIESAYRENTFNYNLAILYYRKPDYDKAMRLLRQAEFDDLLHNLEARKMLLKIYFDLEELEALFSLLDSFKNFIYRQKDLGYHRANYLNLVRFTHKLLQLKPYDKAAKMQLKLEIEGTKSVAEKEWLLQQF